MSDYLHNLWVFAAHIWMLVGLVPIFGMFVMMDEYKRLWTWLLMLFVVVAAWMLPSVALYTAQVGAFSR